MKHTRFFTQLAAALASVAMLSAPVKAAEYPTKQIELVVSYAAGGGTDLVARAYADAINKHLPKSVGVVNKPGGSGALGLTEVARARPDGYKIAMGVVEMTTLPSLGMGRFSIDDFAPIARLNAEPSAITVQADAPWKTYEEFMAYAKANPGKVRIGNSGTGAIWHLAAAALEQKTGVKFNHVPFDGAAPAVAALLGGHIEAVAVSPAEVVAQVQAGKLKSLVVMGDARAKGFEQVPTLKEKGVDLSIGTWRGIVAPKGTPKEVLEVLKTATKKATDEQGFRDALAKMNLTFAYLDADAFGAAIKKDEAFFSTLIGQLGLKK
ncbi:Bug family tripartite tricarboxylate transporter substrate binding protein [Uliginosibacterium sp. sgz301328]|uniref:Bug family tripartite tricarboxylate transporter substrate binding protein n=1 Tax=Uliginosibacterium sp. sgz301328 TaxID=3243764 RepID=UPI00359DCE49